MFLFFSCSAPHIQRCWKVLHLQVWSFLEHNHATIWRGICWTEDHLWCWVECPHLRDPPHERKFLHLHWLLRTETHLGVHIILGWWCTGKLAHTKWESEKIKNCRGFNPGPLVCWTRIVPLSRTESHWSPVKELIWEWSRLITLSWCLSSQATNILKYWGNPFKE